MTQPGFSASQIDPFSRRDPNHRINLCDLLDRLLETGVVVQGSLILSVAGIDLVYVELRLLAGAADKLMSGRPLAGAAP